VKCFDEKIYGGEERRMRFEVPVSDFVNKISELGVYVDSRNEIEEPDEENNKLRPPVIIGPDIVINGINISTSDNNLYVSASI